MIIEDRLLETIIRQNLNMLFSEDMFKIRIEHNEYGDRTKITVHQSELHEVILSSIFEIQTDTKHQCSSMRVVATQFYCEDINDTFEDFVKCCKEIKAKIEEISSHRTMYHETEDGIIVNFREIGIEYADSSFTTRDLFVKRSNDISYVKFNNGGVITQSLDRDAFDVMLMKYINDENVYLDFSAADMIQFVDYDKYIRDDGE
jgi:hypothetical protein